MPWAMFDVMQIPTCKQLTCKYNIIIVYYGTREYIYLIVNFKSKSINIMIVTI